MFSVVCVEQVFLLTDPQHLMVGDKVQIRADLYDGYGRRRTEGGDEVRMWLRTPEGQPMSSVAAHVTDLQNGSYVGETVLKWPGDALVHVSLKYPREVLRLMVWLRLTLLSLRWQKAIFQNEKGVSEVRQICVFLPVPHNACLSSGQVVFFFHFFFTKPDAMLTRVRIPGAARDFTPRFNFQ